LKKKSIFKKEFYYISEKNGGKYSDDKMTDRTKEKAIDIGKI